MNIDRTVVVNKATSAFVKTLASKGFEVLQTPLSEFMWKKIGTATMTTTAITAWFAVVALGLVGQLWPLLEGVP